MTVSQPIFYFDVASPNAYLAWRVLPGIEARTGVSFKPVPVLLGGLFKLSGNQAPMATFAGVPNRLAYERLEMERFVARHGLADFVMNPHFPLNTLAIMRAATAADVSGLVGPFADALFPATWERGLKTDDPQVLEDCLTEAGLPAADLLARSRSPEIKAMLADRTQQAYEHGAFGIPSFLVEGELYFGKERLVDIEERLTSPVGHMARP